MCLSADKLFALEDRFMKQPLDFILCGLYYI